MSNHNKAAISPELRWAVWERDNFTCQICRSRQYLTIDHIIPVSAGGKTEKSNLQTLCIACNCSKGNRAHPSPPLHFTPVKQCLSIINLEFLEPHPSVQEAAKELGRPRVTIYRWIEAGKLVGIKLGGILFIPKSEVERLKNEKAPSVRPGAH